MTQTLEKKVSIMMMKNEHKCRCLLILCQNLVSESIANKYPERKTLIGHHELHYLTDHQDNMWALLNEANNTLKWLCSSWSISSNHKLKHANVGGSIQNFSHHCILHHLTPKAKFMCHPHAEFPPKLMIPSLRQHLQLKRIRFLHKFIRQQGSRVHAVMLMWNCVAMFIKPVPTPTTLLYVATKPCYI